MSRDGPHRCRCRPYTRQVDAPEFPAIWRVTVSDIEGWRGTETQRESWLKPAMHIDHVRSATLGPRRFAAWCAVCDAATEMTLAWTTSTISPQGVVAPDWHGAVTCAVCGLPSNVRAIGQLLLDRGLERSSTVVEGISSTVLDRLTHRFPSINDAETDPGGLFDCVVSVDTVERTADWVGHLTRWRERVRDGGRLVLTTHFDSSLESTVEFGSAAPGAPLRAVGWDVVDILRRTGFGEIVGHSYWAPWQGHLGVTSFVFEAVA